MLTLEQIAEGRGYLREAERDGDVIDLETWLVQHASALLDTAEHVARQGAGCEICRAAPATVCGQCMKEELREARDEARAGDDW